jgi:hypothetical protein
MGLLDGARQARLQHELATEPIIPSRKWIDELAGDVPEYQELADQIITASGREPDLVDRAVLTAHVEIEVKLWLRRAADTMSGRHPRMTWQNIEIVLE